MPHSHPTLSFSSSNNAAIDSAPDKPPWERLLWKKQDYPDNYVPGSFLDGLKTNSSIRLPSVTSIIISSLPISLQFSLIMILISAFYHLRYGSLKASELVWTSLSLLFIGWISLFLVQAFTLSTFNEELPKGIKPLKIRFKFSYILLPLILLALSPVLRTLTEATTDDSIWALSSILLFTNWSLANYDDVDPDSLKIQTNRKADQDHTPSSHLISASNPISSPSSPKASFSPRTSTNLFSSSIESDREFTSTSITSSSKAQATLPNKLLPIPLPTGPSLPPTSKPLPSSLSLNASISASVVLASRLSSSFQVFSLIFFSSILFAGIPRWRIKVLELSLLEKPEQKTSKSKASSSSSDFRSNPSSDTKILKIRTSNFKSSKPNFSNSQHQSQSQSQQSQSRFNSLNLFLKIFSPLLILSTSLFLTSTISIKISILSFMMISFISLICPIWMKWAQKWKNEMSGPWDVGVIRVRS